MSAMTGDELVRALRAAGVRRATGVPCSYFGGFYESVIESGLLYLPASHEGLAVSLAAGWSLAGELPCVLMQNSGLGNAVNPLTSLIHPYRLPLLLMISGRGWKVDDEPQHRRMGEHLEAFLDAAGVFHLPCPTSPDKLTAAVQAAADQARTRHQAVALLVARGTFAKAKQAATIDPSLPTRRELLALLAARLKDEVVVTTTGFTSRELFAAGDRARNFYMQGSMGHAAAIGLGLAESGRSVVVVDGDGAALMHPGAMVMVSQYPGIRLCHLIIANGVYESTGNQPIANRKIPFARLAQGLGYTRVSEVSSAALFDRVMEEALSHPGPACVVANVRPEEEDAPAPRITDTLEHHEVATRLRDDLRAKSPDALDRSRRG